LNKSPEAGRQKPPPEAGNEDHPNNENIIITEEINLVVTARDQFTTETLRRRIKKQPKYFHRRDAEFAEIRLILFYGERPKNKKDFPPYCFLRVSVPPW
jgi:hypothetical protein